jgi:hypothetical protein
MVPAMRAALTDHASAGSNTLRQVVFLTDGDIVMKSNCSKPLRRCAAAHGVHGRHRLGAKPI